MAENRLIGADQTVERARRYNEWHPGGFCLNYVCQMATAGQGLGVYAPSAQHAWDNAKRRHKVGTPPLGSFVFWRSPDGWHHNWGHVAISLGDGWVRSTGIGRRTDVGDTTINNLTRSWGYPYLGWSEDLYGQVQPGLFDEDEEPNVALSNEDKKWVKQTIRSQVVYALRDDPTVRLSDTQRDRIYGNHESSPSRWSVNKALAYIAGQAAVVRRRLSSETDEIDAQLDRIENQG